MRRSGRPRTGIDKLTDVTYRLAIAAARIWFRVGGIRIDLTGEEYIPQTGGALLAINHISYVDTIFAGFPGAQRGRLTRFMGKREVFDHWLWGPLMRSFHNIRVDRDDGAASVAEAVERLRAGELVGIFPEATLSRSFMIMDLKTGAARIAAEAGVPLIPMILWGPQRILVKGRRIDLSRNRTIGISVGRPLRLVGEAECDTATLKIRMEEMLDELIRRHPSDEQPPGSWWLPRAYGGSAPTVEQAKQMYADELRLRALRQEQREDRRTSWIARSGRDVSRTPRRGPR